MSELLEKIRSRGFWKVIIHPSTFNEKRVPNILDLYSVLQKSSVEFGGWDFPHLDTRVKPEIGPDWVGQELDWEHYLELWRFYQSGQLAYFSGMYDDWRDQSTLWPADNNWHPGTDFRVHEAVFRYTEIFEFAARLSRTHAGDQHMHLEVNVKGLQGRTLCNLPGRVRFRYQRKASISELPYKIDLSQLQLITETKDLALKPALELFRRFGWEPPIDLLRDIQTEVLGRPTVSVSL
ncbi:MAG: hypothetical protein FJ316_07285 [SAR202 cluster bacterium]|nr:hypothetical protein [SAR202 cluster bacterium]